MPLARPLRRARAAERSVLRHCDTARDFVWRVRNVPWPAETYEVTVEPESREVVLRTTNRKFFKRLKLPELDAARPKHCGCGSLLKHPRRGTLFAPMPSALSGTSNC